MKALTIWQPWATLIIAGLKPWEFCPWNYLGRPQYRSLAGQRIVIHAATRTVRPAEVAELLNDPRRLAGSCGAATSGRALDILERWWRSREGLPLAAGLGTALLGAPRLATDIFAGELDADEIDPDMWGWPLSAVEPFEPIVPMRGARGFWNWPG